MEAKEHIARYLTAQTIFEGEIDRRQEEFQKYVAKGNARPDIINEHAFHIGEMNKFMQVATQTIMKLSLELEVQTKKATDIQHIVDEIKHMQSQIANLNELTHS
jgi:hypothetical protein